MQSRLRVHGHPIQPMLVTFPFGLFVCATLFDLFDLAGGPTFLGEVGYWTAVAALVAAALAGMAGMVDLWDVPAGATRRTAISFNLANLVMAALFVVTCLVRADAPGRGASGALLATELTALAVGAFGVFLGTHLVRRFDREHVEPGTLDALGAVAGSTVEISRQRA
ncbi:DUF2231 domain-containing protein [Micromonospora sp. WMMD882]|uniref:DUF2231 domain-containing protein n=1 Tax=Micromonospora sp. WMMD882 TaxID=3015151 RepID=UPI00248CAC61|nr:DUF2231 domain-containing protein [Micromonospora sp. WMMD882]WBB81164.1 DUF2231 domain-containing protein [Micromonospora sp. WMMD882]